MSDYIRNNFSLYDQLYQELKGLYGDSPENIAELEDNMPVIFTKIVEDGLGRRVPLIPVQFEYDVVQKQWQAFQENVKGKDYHTRKSEFDKLGLQELIGEMPPFYTTPDQLPLLQQSENIIASINTHAYAQSPDKAWEIIKPRSYLESYVENVINLLSSPSKGIMILNYYGENAADTLMKWHFLSALSEEDWKQNPDVADVIKNVKDFKNSAKALANCKGEQGVVAGFLVSEENRIAKMVGFIHYEKMENKPLWNILQTDVLKGHQDILKPILNHLQGLALRIDEQDLIVSDRKHHPEIDDKVLIFDDQSQTNDYIQAIMDEYLTSKKDHEPYSWELPEIFKGIAKEQAEGFIVKKWMDLAYKPNNAPTLNDWFEMMKNSEEYQEILQFIDNTTDKLKKHPYLQEYLYDYHKAEYKGYSSQEYYQGIVEILTQSQKELEQKIKNTDIEIKQECSWTPKL